MIRNSFVFKNKLFYFEHLFEKDGVISEIKNDFSIFRKSGKGLEIFLKASAPFEERRNENRTYIVRDNKTDEIVGYFSLKAGLISADETVELTVNGNKTTFETFPGIELSAFAVNDRYTEKYQESKGYGSIIFGDFIIPLIKKIQKVIGIKVLYIFALPEKRLIETYEKKYNFKRLDRRHEEKLHKRLKPRFDQGCVFMYQLI